MDKGKDFNIIRLWTLGIIYIIFLLFIGTDLIINPPNLIIAIEIIVLIFLLIGWVIFFTLAEYLYVRRLTKGM